MKSTTPRTPKILYKYMKEGTFGFFLENRSLRFTPADELNDLYEADIHTKGLVSEEALRAFFNGNKNRKRFKREHDFLENEFKSDPEQEERHRKLCEFKDGIKKANRLFIEKSLKFIQDQKKSTCILSMSSSNDSILMWSHYAKDYKGCVVGFDVDSLKKSIERCITILGPNPVLYKAQKPYAYIYNLDEKIFDLMRTKSKDWSYENEWRFVSWTDGDINKCLCSNNHLVEIDVKSIAHIIFSEKHIKENGGESMCNKIQQSLGLGKDKIYVCSKDLEQYKFHNTRLCEIDMSNLNP